MLGFQIHQEYNWSQQKISKLPESVQVVKVVEGREWYRPWSYIKPQVVRFMAVNSGKNIGISSVDINDIDISKDASSDTIKQFNIYLFERRISTKIVPQLINCTQHTIAHMPRHADDTSHEDGFTQDSLDTVIWEPLAADDEILNTVCTDIDNP